jgi:hypothetical protein
MKSCFITKTAELCWLSGLFRNITYGVNENREATTECTPAVLLQ